MARRPLAFFALGILLLAAVVAGVLYHPAMQSFAAHRVAGYLSRVTGFTVSVRRIEIPLRGREIYVHDVVVEVPEGHVALSARRIAVELNLSALSTGKIAIPRIHISDGYAGVFVRGDRAEPVDTIVETIEKLTASTDPTSSTSEAPTIQLGVLSWSNISGFFWLDDPSMVGTAGPLSGELDLSQSPIQGSYFAENLEYMVLEWPFTASQTRGELSIGDWVKLEGVLPTRIPQGNLRYTVEVSTGTGDVSVHAVGELDTSIVPAHFTPYPYLEGTATVDVSLGSDEAFWLQARVQANALRIEEQGRVERLHVRMDMNDSRMHFTEIRGHIQDLAEMQSGTLDVTGSIIFGPPVDLFFGGSLQGLDLAHVRQTFSPVDLDLDFAGRYDGHASASLRVTESVSLVAQLDGRATELEAQLDTMTHRDSSVRVQAQARINTDPLELDLNVVQWRGQTSVVTGAVAYADGRGLALDLTGQLGSQSLPWSQWLPEVHRVGVVTFDAHRKATGAFHGSFSALGLQVPWLNGSIRSEASVTSMDGQIYQISDASIRVGDSHIESDARVNLASETVDLSHMKAHVELGNLVWEPTLTMQGAVDVRGSVQYQWQQEWIRSIILERFEAPFVSLGGDVAVTLPPVDCEGSGEAALRCAVGREGWLTLGAKFGPGMDVELELGLSQAEVESLRIATIPLRAILSADLRVHAREGLWRVAGSFAGQSVWLDKYAMGAVHSDFSVIQTTHDWSSDFSLIAANDVTHFAAVFQRDPQRDQAQTLWMHANWPSQYDLLSDGSLGLTGSGLMFLTWSKDVVTELGLQLEEFSLRQNGTSLVHLVEPLGLSVSMGTSVRHTLGLQFRDEIQVRQWPVTLQVDNPQSWSLSALASAPLKGLEAFVPVLRFGEGSVAGDAEFGHRPNGYYLKGDLNLTQTALALPELGISGQLLAGRARLQDWRIDLSDIEVRTDSGSIDGSARIDLAAPDLAIEAELGLDSVAIRPATGVDARVSGPLTLQYADPGPLYIRGKLELLSGLLSDRIDWEQSLLQFQRRDKRALSSVQNSPVILQLSFINDNALKIDNNLAKLAVDGNFVLSGAADNPGIVGNLNAVSGGALFWQGQVYEIENGLVQFIDPLVLNPQVEVLAKTTVEEQSDDEIGSAREYQVVLHAHGELDSLQVDYDSDPYLPKEEIVSLLNFGVTSLSGGSGQAAGTEFLLGPQLDPIESEIKDLIGIDSIDFRPTYDKNSESSTMTVKLQKRFTNKLRMRLESSVDQVGGQRVGFDYGITRSLSLSLGWDNESSQQTGNSGNFSLQPRLRIPLP